MTDNLNLIMLRDLLAQREEHLNQREDALGAGDLYTANNVQESLDSVEEVILGGLPAILGIAEDRDLLLKIINDCFLTINNPTSTLAFDGRNLTPHIEEASRYTEILRIERDNFREKLERSEVNLKAANSDCEWADSEIARLNVATMSEIASAKKLKAEVDRQTAYLRQLLDHNRNPVVTIHKQMLIQTIIEPLENASDGKP